MLIGWQVYEGGQAVRDGTSLDDALAARHEGDFLWVRLGTPEEAELARLTTAFDLPELAVEDALHGRQRPKLERYGDTSFFVLRPAVYDDEEEDVALGEVHVFTGPAFVITISHGHVDPFDPVCRRLVRSAELLRMGPAAVLYAVADEVVDAYTPVVRGLEHDVDEIEQEVFAVDRQPPTERIYGLIREVLDFQRATANLLLPLDDLASGRSPGITPELSPYFRDVADHARLVHERSEQLRQLLSGALDANVALIGLRENRDQRKISAWAAIALVPTVIGGLWGMNVEGLPFENSALGFPALVVLAVGVSVYLYLQFRRNEWL